MTETKTQEMAYLTTPNSSWTNSPSISCQWKGNDQGFYMGVKINQSPIKHLNFFITLCLFELDNTFILIV